MNEEAPRNKILPVVIGILSLLILAGIYLWFFRSPSYPTPGTTDGSTGVLPTPGTTTGGTTSSGTTTGGSTGSTTGTIPTGEKFSIQTRTGAPIEIKNFYPTAVDVRNDYVLIKGNPDYDMLFFPKEDSFLITLNNADVHLARAEAESDFPVILGIPTPQACDLKVSLTIPFEVSEEYGGKDYGLSFCPWGKPF